MELIWVVEAKYIKDFIIYLKFNDGISGEINLFDYLNLKIYAPLKDKTYFQNFKLNSWTVEWENGADFAPEFLYRKMIDKRKKIRKKTTV